jgi:hypothetical protein
MKIVTEHAKCCKYCACSAQNNAIFRDAVECKIDGEHHFNTEVCEFYESSNDE